MKLRPPPLLRYYANLAARGNGAGKHARGVLAVLRVLRLARVFRVFKLVGARERWALLEAVLRRAAPMLAPLLLFVAFELVIFGSLAFYVEQGEWRACAAPDSACGDGAAEAGEWRYLRPSGDGASREPSPFVSIPVSLWWVLATVTTVGYGDMVPTSGLGRLVGMACMVSGVLVMALPISVVTTEFGVEYRRYVRVRRRRRRRRASGGDEDDDASAEDRDDDDDDAAADPDAPGDGAGLRAEVASCKAAVARLESKLDALLSKLDGTAR